LVRRNLRLIYVLCIDYIFNSRDISREKKSLNIKVEELDNK